MRSITSVNIACGGHAGDEQTMKTTIEQRFAGSWDRGASGYADRANFGGWSWITAERDCGFCVRTGSRTCANCGWLRCAPSYVKPHGALYNQAVGNRELAEAIAKGVAQWNAMLCWWAWRVPMLDVFREAGFAVAPKRSPTGGISG